MVKRKDILTGSTAPKVYKLTVLIKEFCSWLLLSWMQQKLSFSRVTDHTDISTHMELHSHKNVFQPFFQTLWDIRDIGNRDKVLILNLLLIFKRDSYFFFRRTVVLVLIFTFHLLLHKDLLLLFKETCPYPYLAFCRDRLKLLLMSQCEPTMYP